MKSPIRIVGEWLEPGTLELRCGEMTNQEKKTVKAVLNAIMREIEISAGIVGKALKKEPR